MEENIFLTGYDVKRAGLIFAIQAEIHGMVAENEVATQCEVTPPYGSGAFDAKAEELRNVVYMHDHQI